MRQPCIRCGECAAACPADLYPQAVLAAVQRDDIARAQALGLKACNGCGQCDAYCPSRIPLQAIFAVASQPLVAERARREFAHAARQRYLARNARLTREAEEQAAERERQNRANASAQAVAAALARKRAQRPPAHPDTQP